jgi:hypothetical protein
MLEVHSVQRAGSRFLADTWEKRDQAPDEDTKEGTPPWLLKRYFQ